MFGFWPIRVYVIVEKCTVKCYLVSEPRIPSEDASLVEGVQGLCAAHSWRCGDRNFWSESRCQQPLSWEAALICSQRLCSTWAEAPVQWVHEFSSEDPLPRIQWFPDRGRCWKRIMAAWQGRVKTKPVSLPAHQTLFLLGWVSKLGVKWGSKWDLYHHFHFSFFFF